MNYELINLEILAEKIIDPKTKARSSKNIEQEIYHEFERLSILIYRHSVLLSRKESSLFIRGHQRSLLKLLDKISVHQEPSNPIINQFIAQGCKFLHELSRQFQNVINWKLVLSEKLLKFYDPHILQLLTILKRKLELSANCSQELKDIIYQALNLQINNAKMISLGQLNYLHELNNVISTVLDESQSEREILEALIMINFNESSFLKYCLKLISPEASAEKLTEVMLRLINTRKRIQQIIPRKTLKYQQTLPKTATFLLNYISKEIQYLHKLSKINKDFEQGNFIDSRFKVSLSVKQLAYFIQLQVECGIILEERPKFIHNYVVSHYSTLATEAISEKSFKNGYYVHAPEDVKKIIQMLSKMITLAKGVS